MIPPLAGGVDVPLSYGEQDKRVVREGDRATNERLRVSGYLDTFSHIKNLKTLGSE